ncbi:MAG: hypothetical protein NPIRA04_33450 [Nitrospirales bacterium]|nr:MAG: hypothetical protein NPIRA04_33450 [Nitrospirales bacterium]
MSEERAAVAQEDRVLPLAKASSSPAPMVGDAFSRGAADVSLENPSRTVLPSRLVASETLPRTFVGCGDPGQEVCDHAKPSPQLRLAVHTENIAPKARLTEGKKPLTNTDFEVSHTTDSTNDRGGNALTPVIENPEEDLAKRNRSLEEVWADAIEGEPISAAQEASSMSKDTQNRPVFDIYAMSAESEPMSSTNQKNVGDEPTVADQKQSATKPNSKNGGYRWDEIGIRGGFNAEYVAIPPTEKEDFEQFGIFGAYRFPKQYYYDSGWEIYFRMNGSLGALRGDGDLGFIGTVSPGIVFWYPDWNISINGGPGLAYISREKYGRQDLGGPIQIVGQGGLTYYVTDHIGIGWRFHHISDAGIWGSDNRGVDVNLFELTYKF